MALGKVAVGVAAALSVNVGAGRLSKSSATCGKKGPSSQGGRIVNGDRADECEWTWQVGLRSSAYGTPWCGGMLISDEWVLTAAHCIDGSDVNVIAGEWDTNKKSNNEQHRWASKQVVHNKYDDSTMDNDFALLKLESPMTMNSCVGTVCLPEEGNDVEPGTLCWISGWGTLSSGGNQPRYLQEAAVSVLSNRQCKNTGYSSSEITNNMLCAQGMTPDGQVMDACQGDSGGPLVCDKGGVFSIYGATSWGYGCADKNYPGVWARVHEALGWIEDVMDGNAPDTPNKCPSWCSKDDCWFSMCAPCC